MDFLEFFNSLLEKSTWCWSKDLWVWSSWAPQLFLWPQTSVLAKRKLAGMGDCGLLLLPCRLPTFPYHLSCREAVVKLSRHTRSIKYVLKAYCIDLYIYSMFSVSVRYSQRKGTAKSLKDDDFPIQYELLIIHGSLALKSPPFHIN